MRRSLVLALLVLAAGLVAPGAAGATGAPRPLALVTCPTLAGAPGPVEPLPTGLAASVPARYRGRVALYVDRDHRLAPVLAPRGWRCHAEDAADGQAGLEVLAPGGARAGLVTASLDGPCRTCVAADVCRLSAVRGFSATSGAVPCPTTPAGERSRFLRGAPASRRALVTFVAPARGRIPYGAWPPRPPVAARTAGRMAYDLSGAPWARIVTCALPGDLAGLCGAVVARLG